MRNILAQIGKQERCESSPGRHPEPLAKDLCPGEEAESKVIFPETFPEFAKWLRRNVLPGHV